MWIQLTISGRNTMKGEGKPDIDILATVSPILDECDIYGFCLGRQFAKLGTGLTNRQCGHALKVSLSMQNNTPLPDITTHHEDCEMCSGFFDGKNLMMRGGQKQALQGFSVSVRRYMSLM